MFRRRRLAGHDAHARRHHGQRRPRWRRACGYVKGATDGREEDKVAGGTAPGWRRGADGLGCPFRHSPGRKLQSAGATGGCGAGLGWRGSTLGGSRRGGGLKWTTWIMEKGGVSEMDAAMHGAWPRPRALARWIARGRVRGKAGDETIVMDGAGAVRAEDGGGWLVALDGDRKRKRK
ncbi:hypothetical protein BD413DRAFT_139611 [Trametes elegans]|nr:hypothetical protein BD413DRAFT_139611 [Trametes elegans]